MATYSFKHVGTTRTQRRTEENSISGSLNQIGIKTPLREGSNELFEMHTSYEGQIDDNFRNMMLTNWGERLGRYRYGGNLMPLMSEYSGHSDFETETLERIKNATSTWMPYIELDELVINENSEETNKRGLPVIDVSIKYDIPILNVKGKVLQLTLHAI